MAYPTGLDSIPQPGAGSLTNSPSHAGIHDLEIVAIQALEAKVGTGASTPVASTLLRGTGTGTSAYAQAVLTTDVTGTLPVANGGTGVTGSTGSGNVVLSTSPALTTPTGIVKGDVGLGNVDNTSDATKNAATATLTNKTIDGSQLVDASVVSRKAALTIVGADGSTVNPIPTTITDIPSSTVTFTLATASYLLLTVSTTLQNNVTTNVYVYLNVDGVDNSRYLWTTGITSNSVRETISRTWKLTLAAGSHTIKLRTIADTVISAVVYDPSWFALVVSQ